MSTEMSVPETKPETVENAHERKGKKMLKTITFDWLSLGKPVQVR